jgi:hypothetical protein
LIERTATKPCKCAQRAAKLDTTLRVVAKDSDVPSQARPNYRLTLAIEPIL